jgi:hypothetical protein
LAHLVSTFSTRRLERLPPTTGITGETREGRRTKKEPLTRKLTEVAGRMSSSKARFAQVIPRSKVWRAVASSSSLELASSPVVVAHEEHASSSVRTSPPAAPWERDAPSPRPPGSPG